MYINKTDLERLEKVINYVWEQKVGFGLEPTISTADVMRAHKVYKKLEAIHEEHIKETVQRQREKRKTNKAYGREIYYKQYLADREKAKKEGRKLGKTIAEYKAEYQEKKKQETTVEDQVKMLLRKENIF